MKRECTKDAKQKRKEKKAKKQKQKEFQRRIQKFLNTPPDQRRTIEITASSL